MRAILAAICAAPVLAFPLINYTGKQITVTQDLTRNEVQRINFPRDWIPGNTSHLAKPIAIHKHPFDLTYSELWEMLLDELSYFINRLEGYMRCQNFIRAFGPPHRETWEYIYYAMKDVYAKRSLPRETMSFKFPRYVEHYNAVPSAFVIRGFWYQKGDKTDEFTDKKNPDSLVYPVLESVPNAIGVQVRDIFKAKEIDYYRMPKVELLVHYFRAHRWIRIVNTFNGKFKLPYDKPYQMLEKHIFEMHRAIELRSRTPEWHAWKETVYVAHTRERYLDLKARKMTILDRDSNIFPKWEQEFILNGYKKSARGDYVKTAYVSDSESDDD